MHRKWQGYYGWIAQLAERWSMNSEVVGLNPTPVEVSSARPCLPYLR